MGHEIQYDVSKQIGIKEDTPMSDRVYSHLRRSTLTHLLYLKVAQWGINGHLKGMQRTMFMKA